MLVCIIDDDKDMLANLSDLIEICECRPMTFSTAEAALAAIREGTQFDLVLTDENLGGQMSGSQLAHYLSNSSVEIPIVVMSGYGQICEESLPPNVELILGKPFGLAELRAILDRFRNEN